MPNTNYLKKKKCTIIALVFSSLLLIGGVVVLIGYLSLGWFKKEEKNIFEIERKENYVSRYLETKNATYSYKVDDTNNSTKIINNTILTDFIVGINKKNSVDKNYDLNQKDYLYEAFLLIINCTQLNETDTAYLGGINIYDDSKTIED